MKKILSNPITLLICRLTVGWVFVSFGISKIISPADFAKEISNYQMLPVWSLNLGALILPWIELIAGTMLIFGIRIKTNALLISGLLTMFIIMVATAWAKGLDISCGCSATNPMKVGLPKILENTGLVLMCAVLWVFPRNVLTISNLKIREE